MKNKCIVFVFFALNIMLTEYKVCAMFQRGRLVIRRLVTQRSNNGIQGYEPERDKNAVKEIAIKNVSRLVSMGIFEHSKNAYEKALNSNIMPAFDDKGIESKVYILDGSPVAFINYSIYEPWYKYYVPQRFECGQKAIIYHLAVRDDHQGKGIGTDLMKHAMQDCQNSAVSYITLGTTTSELDSFYEKLGFKVKQRPTYTQSSPTKWGRRLKPSLFARDE